MRRKHADLIKEWAEGAEIEFKDFMGNWIIAAENILWHENTEYRIKIEKKPDITLFFCASVTSARYGAEIRDPLHNISVTFDGDTHKPIKVDIL
jgi:hypothetical protein